MQIMKINSLHNNVFFSFLNIKKRDVYDCLLTIG